MHFETEPGPMPRSIRPVLANVPVYHKERRIGTAKINGEGDVTIKIEREFDKTEIFNSFMTGFAQGITFSIESPPAVEIRKIINREY